MSAEVYESIKNVLKDENSPGIRLTSEFKNIDLNVGRITGFVYGYKEHGSKWVQQNIMLAYGLYKQGLVEQGNEIMQEVYDISTHNTSAQIFPGIPSYFDNDNKGAYAYLTGSSSWYLLTLITQIFGVKGHYGRLHFEPKLSLSYFDDDACAVVSTKFSGYNIEVTYINENRLDYGKYSIGDVEINGQKTTIASTDRKKCSIFLSNFSHLFNSSVNKIRIKLN